MKKILFSILLIFLLILTIFTQANTLQIPSSNDKIIEKKPSIYPGVEYSTFIGGIGLDWGIGIAVDSKGCAYVTGLTRSINFPTKNPYDGSYNFLGDAFVTKLSSSGKSLEYSTFIGGSNFDIGIMITVDNEDCAYICGSTKSNDFPLKNSIQNHNNGKNDVFVVKLSPSGGIIYSTLIGGSEDDLPRDLALDKNGSIYVTGRTKSKDFPMKNPYDETHNGTWDAFVFKISPDGDELNFSSFIGGTKDEWGYGIAVDNNDCIYLSGNTSSPDFPNTFNTSIKGEDAYVMKLDPSENTYILNYSKFLGGNGDEKGWGLTVDEQGNAYVCGRTNSTDFPLQNPVQKTKKGGWDIYVTKLSKNGDSLIYSTYIGGNGDMEEANRITVDQQGCAYITGFTTSSNFPVMNPSDGTYNGNLDSYAIKLSPNGDKLLYSTYLGGRNKDDGYQIAVDEKGCFYATGWTESPNFLIKNPYDGKYNGFRDAFVTKFSPTEYSQIKKVKGGLSITVALSSDEKPLNWSITVDGKILSGGKSNGTIPPYSYETVRLKSTIGYGKVNITIRANDAKQYYSAFLFGPFFLNLKSM
jgi:hypothetical protein